MFDFRAVTTPRWWGPLPPAGDAPRRQHTLRRAPHRGASPALGRPVTRRRTVRAEPRGVRPDIAELALEGDGEAMPAGSSRPATIHVLTTATVSRLRALPAGPPRSGASDPTSSCVRECRHAEFVESKGGRELGSATTLCSRSPTTARAASDHAARRSPKDSGILRTAARLASPVGVYGEVRQPGEAARRHRDPRLSTNHTGSHFSPERRNSVATLFRQN
jgi:hypothetical protein